MKVGRGCQAAFEPLITEKYRSFRARCRALAPTGLGRISRPDRRGHFMPAFGPAGPEGPVFGSPGRKGGNRNNGMRPEEGATLA